MFRGVSWIKRRLAYTRATAVNSMAGYVIGLGDRHSHNILIHTRTAEARFFAAITPGILAVHYDVVRRLRCCNHHLV